jgi:hypothetical protein
MQIDPMHGRYHGKSSGAKLIWDAFSAKSGLASQAPKAESELVAMGHGVFTRRPEIWQAYEVRGMRSMFDRAQVADGEGQWEKEYLSSGPSVRTPVPFNAGSIPSGQASTTLTFPPDDLLSKLIDSYFTHVNVITPLLHRPSFERSVALGTHLRDADFGEVLLLVCAVGAHYVDDARVLLDGVTKHSAGWEWFRQVPVMQRSVFTVPTLYDLQLCCVRAFSHLCRKPQADGRHPAASDVSPRLYRPLAWFLERSWCRHTPCSGRRGTSEKSIQREANRAR